MDPRTPEVFIDFMWPNYTKYPSYLEIDVKFCNRITDEKLVKHYSRAPWEKEVNKDEDELDLLKGRADFGMEQKDLPKDNPRTRRWEKFENESSQIPFKLEHKLETEKQGALRMQFSNKGKYLAIACTKDAKSGSRTIIKIHDVEAKKDESL